MKASDLTEQIGWSSVHQPVSWGKRRIAAAIRRSECRQSLHSDQTERNAGRFGVFSLVGVVAYGREENTPKGNDGGHFARQFHLNYIIQLSSDTFIFDLKNTVSLPLLQVCLQPEIPAEKAGIRFIMTGFEKMKGFIMRNSARSVNENSGSSALFENGVYEALEMRRYDLTF